MSENQIEIIPADQREVELLEKNRKISLQKLFTPAGMDLIIAEIEKEVATFSADVTTKEGRAKIVSMAAKVAKCKSPIEKLAKEAKDESQRIIAAVQTQWKRYEGKMDELRDKIRKPVDDIEEKEAAELEARQNRLAAMENLRLSTSGLVIASSEFEKLIKEVKNYLQFDWGDFAFKAETLAEDLILHFQQREMVAKKSEADAAELAQLKKEKEERDKKDREEQIAKDAAEKARKDEEERIKKIEEEKRVEQAKRIVAERKAQIMALGLVQDITTGYWTLPGVKKFVKIFPSELFAKDFEIWDGALKNVAMDIEVALKEQKIIDDEAAEKAKKEAKEREDKAAADAIENERLRVEEEKRKEDEATEKREKNRKHRAKINNQSLEAIAEKIEIMSRLDHKEVAKVIVEAIAKGEIPNVQINY